MDFRVLGPIAAATGSGSARLGGPRQRAVLAMLALAAPDVVSTDRLVDGIWGEDPPAKPLPTLQVFVHNLRKALREIDPDGDLILSAPPGYRLDVTPETIDAGRFERLVAQARDLRNNSRAEDAAAALSEALGLWRGPALADVRDAPFAEAEAVRLDDLRLLADEERFDLALQLGRHQESVAELEERVRAHPTRERFWGQLMVALYRSDRQADALAAYGRAREQLADKLGIDPGEALQQLELAILRQDPELAAAPARTVSPRPQARVPTPATATFGRDEMVADVVRTLDRPDVRIVSLTGPGGSGKSRVAMLAAAAAADRHPGGVFYLTATEATKPDQLLREATHILTGADTGDPAEGEAPEPERPPALLVLDNLEVLTESPEWITRLVTALPYVTVLATSRLPLRLSAEHDLDVPPLTTPPPGADRTETAESPAVLMFVDRARATSPAFDADSQLDDIAELCRFLDGVPLALELAAAQSRVLPVAGILRHLTSGLGLLKSRSVDVPARQQTLATTVQWSYDRLSESARAVCDLAALFERSFTIEALEAVCDDVPGVLDDVAEIVEARLVRPLPARVEIRFVVLGTVRAFARQRLAGHDGIERRRDLLARYLLDRARTWSAELDGPDGAVVLGRFDDEEADLTAALERAVAEPDPDLAVALALALSELWIASGRLNDGLTRTRQTLALTGLSHDDQIRLRVVAGKLAYHLTDWRLAIDECTAALDLCADGCDPLVAADAKLHLGGALIVTGETGRGAELAAEALAAAAGDHRITVRALSMLAIAAAVTGDWAEERARYEERLVLVRARGDRARAADTLNTLAEIALDESDAETARAYATESLDIAQPALPLELRDALITLARAAVIAGDPKDAAEHLRAALRLSDRTGQRLAYAQCLRVGACIVGAAGDATLAVRLFAAAQEHCPSPSGTTEPVERDLAGALARSQEVLGDSDFQREWRIGGHLPLPSLRQALESHLAQ